VQAKSFFREMQSFTETKLISFVTTERKEHEAKLNKLSVETSQTHKLILLSFLNSAII